MKKQPEFNSSKANFSILLMVSVLLSLIVGSTALFLHLTSEKTHLVYINEIELMKKYKGMLDIKQELDAKEQTWKMNLDTLKNEADLAVNNYEIAKRRMSDKEKAFSEESIRTKQQQYLEYQQAVQELYKKREKELSEKLLKTVNARIKRFADENNYDLILSGQQGNLAYGNKKLDVTAELLKILNSEYELNK